MEQKSHIGHRWAHRKSPSNVQRDYHQSPVWLHLRLHVHIRLCLRAHRGMCVLSQCVYICQYVTAWRTWLQANISAPVAMATFQQSAASNSFLYLLSVSVSSSSFLLMVSLLSSVLVLFCFPFSFWSVTHSLFMSNWPSRLAVVCCFHRIMAPWSFLITELQ